MPVLPVPDLVVESVLELEGETLRGRGRRLLLADLDNTLGKYGQPGPEKEVLAWRERLRAAGVELFLLSNSRKSGRAESWAKALGIPVEGHAGKPRLGGYRRAMARMGVRPEETAMVGDQIFTDIWGARRAGILAILVEPIELKGNPGRYLRYAAETPFRALGKRRGRA